MGESSAARGVVSRTGGVDVPSRGPRATAAGVSTAAAAAKTWPRAGASSASWLSRRVVVVPRTKVSLSAAKAAHRRRRSSSDTERLRESSKLSSTIGTSTRRVGSSEAAILWSGGGRSGISQQKRSKNLGREDEQTHCLTSTLCSPGKGRFRHALRDSRSSPRAPAGCEACPRNERGAGPLVEMPWFCPGHRACDPTSNAPSAGEPASSACRPMFTPRIALTPPKP